MEDSFDRLAHEYQETAVKCISDPSSVDTRGLLSIVDKLALQIEEEASKRNEAGLAGAVEQCEKYWSLARDVFVMILQVVHVGDAQFVEESARSPKRKRSRSCSPRRNKSESCTEMSSRLLSLIGDFYVRVGKLVDDLTTECEPLILAGVETRASCRAILLRLNGFYYGAIDVFRCMQASETDTLGDPFLKKDFLMYVSEIVPIDHRGIANTKKVHWESLSECHKSLKREIIADDDEKGLSVSCRQAVADLKYVFSGMGTNKFDVLFSSNKRETLKDFVSAALSVLTVDMSHVESGRGPVPAFPSSIPVELDVDAKDEFVVETYFKNPYGRLEAIMAIKCFLDGHKQRMLLDAPRGAKGELLADAACLESGSCDQEVKDLVKNLDSAIEVALADVSEDIDHTEEDTDVEETRVLPDSVASKVAKDPVGFLKRLDPEVPPSAPPKKRRRTGFLSKSLSLVARTEKNWALWKASRLLDHGKAKIVMGCPPWTQQATILDFLQSQNYVPPEEKTPFPSDEEVQQRRNALKEQIKNAKPALLPSLITPIKSVLGGNEEEPEGELRYREKKAKEFLEKVVMEADPANQITDKSVDDGVFRWQCGYLATRTFLPSIARAFTKEGGGGEDG